MRVAILTTFRKQKKEPLSATLLRVHQAFQSSGLAEPAITFTFSDAPIDGFTSSVQRAVKRFPQLRRFQTSAPLLPSAPAAAQISNGPGTPAAGQSLPFETLLEITNGIPRSFPFHGALIHFYSPEFGETLPMPALVPAKTPGIAISDSWWVNGRNRNLAALTILHAPMEAQELPPSPAAVQSVLAACGKPTDVLQLPLPGFETAPDTMTASLGPRNVLYDVSTIVNRYKAQLSERMDRAALPHAIEADTDRGQVSGPKKPALVAAFKPLGYSCRGESGAFTLRRRTPSNHTIEISLDVGTWSNSLTGFFEVQGLGFAARLPMPVSKQTIGRPQIPIGGAERWTHIVQNLAALTAELDRSFVPEIEAAGGPVPAWYKPKT